MNRLIAFFLIATLLFGMVACNKDSGASLVAESSPPGDSVQEEQSSTPPVESENDAENANEFLTQAHDMGYTDAQLETLYDCEVPEDIILNLTNTEPDYDFFIGETTDGRYRLDGYYVTPFLGCMYVMDQQSEQATILPEWQYGYSTFDLLDDDTFYVAAPHVGGTDNEAGIRIYQFEQPTVPAVAWNLTDSSMEGSTLKGLLETYHIPQEQLFVVFWYETPVEWGGWTEEDTETYRVSVVGYDGIETGTFNTGIGLQNGKTGISAPNVGKSNLHRDPVADSIFFELDDTVYMLNYVTGDVAAL